LSRTSPDRIGINLHSSEAKKYFFFEKKKQKTFTFLVDATYTMGTCPSEQKFFGSFFQKKNCFLSLVNLSGDLCDQAAN
jgi:hypothetical protein